MRKRIISFLDRVEASGGNLTMEDWNELHRLREAVKIVDANSVQKVKGEHICLVTNARSEIEKVLGKVFEDTEINLGTLRKHWPTPSG